MATRASKKVYDGKAYAAAVRKLISDRPHCAECAKEGLLAWGDETDHIVPLSEGGHPWRQSNLQRLCVKHHYAKSAREARRRKHPKRKRKPLTDDRGRPLTSTSPGRSGA